MEFREDTEQRPVGEAQNELVDSYDANGNSQGPFNRFNGKGAGKVSGRPGWEPSKGAGNGGGQGPRRGRGFVGQWAPRASRSR